MLASEGNEPTRPYVYLDWEDVGRFGVCENAYVYINGNQAFILLTTHSHTLPEKARGESDLPAEYFNIKHGWGNAKDEKKLELWKQRGGMTAQVCAHSVLMHEHVCVCVCAAEMVCE